MRALIKACVGFAWNTCKGVIQVLHACFVQSRAILNLAQSRVISEIFGFFLKTLGYFWTFRVIYNLDLGQKSWSCTFRGLGQKLNYSLVTSCPRFWSWFLSWPPCESRARILLASPSPRRRRRAGQIQGRGLQLGEADAARGSSYVAELS